MRSPKTRIVRGQDLANPSESREILVTIYGKRIGQKYELDPLTQPLIVGRDLSSDIMVDDDSVSRQHCKLQRTENGWSVVDTGSTNGTYVAGRSVKESPLCDGDLIKVGSTIFKFLSTANIEAAYYEEIYRMAIFDGLTQIHNRRYFEEFTEREICRSKRHGRKLSLIMFDVDHFKQINDRFGHLSGDHVLRTLASRIVARVRREELFARYAGDEFVVVLPETTSSDAFRFAEMLRTIVEETEFRFDGQVLTVHISLGVGVLSDAMNTPPELVAAADAALYRAKEKGRNTVSL